jgi:hypothetical protein
MYFLKHISATQISRRNFDESLFRPVSGRFQKLDPDPCPVKNQYATLLLIVRKAVFASSDTI